MASLATTIPKADAQNKKRICASRSSDNCFVITDKIPGKVPAEPAVGVAQIIPMDALTSFVAMAF